MTYNYRLVGRLLPIDVDHNIFYHRPVVDDPELRRISCHTSPPLPTTKRTEFSARGCTIYGYPSTGGVLIKDADLLDMIFLSLPRSYELQRSADVDKEDIFCHLLRRTGAKWWSSRWDKVEVLLGAREMTEEEKKNDSVWLADRWSRRFRENEFSDEYGGEDTDDERVWRYVC
ncbi:hypothetical protein N7481_000685 [Penicillium waksmanii]|uniref:uncharacterized protein n=1 Tax=Penicillium waksmanii TaxID=69791 RepID=UPI0025490879|nr:uncharacterized protein N7481_000685 [Penicillium waksmanii]KAJ6000276.1 hypothetical protein N7481_000685 [Penicillium waksmanii]